MKLECQISFLYIQKLQSKLSNLVFRIVSKVAVTLTTFMRRFLFSNEYNFPSIISVYSMENIHFDILSYLITFLDIRSVLAFSITCKKYRKLVEYIYFLILNTKLNDNQLKIFKNLKILHCDENKIITNEGIKNLPLEKLYCGNNTNFTDDISLREILRPVGT